MIGSDIILEELLDLVANTELKKNKDIDFVTHDIIGIVIFNIAHEEIIINDECIDLLTTCPLFFKREDDLEFKPIDIIDKIEESELPDKMKTQLKKLVEKIQNSEFYGRFRQPDMSDEYISELLGDNNKECYNVLIAHNPMYFDYYERWGADLVISGHIHGGIMRLPYLGGVISPQIRLFPKYSGGLYTINKAKMILSRGLGTHTIRFRFFNPPELVVVNPINRER